MHRGLRTLHLRMAAHAESRAPWWRCCRRATTSRRPLAGLLRDGELPPARTRSASSQRTELFTLAESLGGVESLIEVPQAMTHQSVEGSAAAVPADLVRLSCGIEEPQDLAEDLARALGG